VREPSLFEMVMHPWATLKRLQGLDRIPDRRVSRHRGPIGRGMGAAAGYGGAIPDPVDPLRRTSRAQSINKALGVYALEESRTELYENYREMDSDAMLAAVLDAFGLDATQRDSEKRRVIWCESPNEDIRKLGMRVIDMLGLEQKAFPTCRALARDADVFYHVAASRGQGVLAIRPYEPWTVARLEDNIGRLIGFAPADEQGRASQTDKSSVPHYRVLHYRLPARELTDIYGAASSYFWGARITWRELQLMLDQVVIQRLLRRPDRLMVLMDATGMTYDEAWMTVADLQRRLHRETYTNPGANQFLSMGVPLDHAMDVVLPRGPNNTTEITNFPATNTNDILRDVDMILAMLAASVGFPLGFVGRGDPGTYQPGVSLSKQSQPFGKRAEQLQNAFLLETARLLMIDQAFRGLNPRSERNQFTLHMASVHPIAEIERNEVIAMRMDRMERALLMGTTYGFNLKEWVPLVLELHGGFTREVISRIYPDAGGEPPSEMMAAAVHLGKQPYGPVGEANGKGPDKKLMEDVRAQVAALLPPVAEGFEIGSRQVTLAHAEEDTFKPKGLDESTGKGSEACERLVGGEVLPFGKVSLDVGKNRVAEIRRQSALTRVRFIAAMAQLPALDQYGNPVAEER
jgi:hypothetical protein